MTTTSGLFAGSSGCAVTVGGTTTLTAAALASSADASKNSLVTGALVTQNLTNSMNWKASYWGFSFSASNTGVSGIQPGLSQKQSGSSSGIAQATIAPGTVTILNAALQKSLTGKTPDQIVAALNRSATAQNKAANTLPGGLLQTLQNQADRSNALMAASSSTAKLVGDVASMFKDSADQTVARLTALQKQQNGYLSDDDKAILAAAQAQSLTWGEDGMARVLLHGATQGMLAWLGGGFSLDAGFRGAGGAMLASALAPLVTEQAQKLLSEAGLGGDPQTTAILAKLVGELVITGIGASLGNEGAVTAASVYMNNYLTHEQRDALKKKMQELFALQWACTSDATCDPIKAQEQQLIDYYQNLSASQSAQLLVTCQDKGSQACSDGMAELQGFLAAKDPWYVSFSYSPQHYTNGGTDQILYDVLNTYRNSDMSYQDVLSSYKQQAAELYASNNRTDGWIKVLEGGVTLGGLAFSRCGGPAGVASCITIGTIAGLQVGEGAYQIYTGGPNISLIHDALVAKGFTDEEANQTVNFIMMGAMTINIVNGASTIVAQSSAGENLLAKVEGQLTSRAGAGDASAATQAPQTLAAAAEDAAQWRPCNLCFAAGTLVKTEAGYEPIESLTVGRLVQSEDVKTGAISLHRITHVHVRPATDIKTFYKLAVSKGGSDEDLYVTGEHPFWLPDTAEWKNVDDLGVGDTLLDFGGHRLHVSAKLALSEKRETYNITVEGTSTYFVGRSEVLVHNCLPTGFTRDAATGIITENATGAVWKLAGTTIDGKAILENLGPSRNLLNPFVTAGDTGEAVTLPGGSGSNSALWNNKTGTVWDSVTPTQGTLPVTELPRSFILETEGENVWVAPNAVKHLQEDAAALINNQAVNPMFVQIQVQANLTSLQEAVGVATQNGITYDTLMNVGGWELKFSPGRAADQLPALFHAQPMGVGK